MGRRSQERLAWQQTRSVVGCAMEVINHLGHGLLEKPYERALVVELEAQNIPVVQQPRYPITYKGTSVGKLVPDLIIFDRLIAETKVVDKLTYHETGQIMN